MSTADYATLAKRLAELDAKACPAPWVHARSGGNYDLQDERLIVALRNALSDLLRALAVAEVVRESEAKYFLDTSFDGYRAYVKRRADELLRQWRGEQA